MHLAILVLVLVLIKCSLLHVYHLVAVFVDDTAIREQV